MNIYRNQTSNTINPTELMGTGIHVDRMDPKNYSGPLNLWKKTKGLTVEKQVEITPDLKNLGAILDFSSQDHLHLTDEAWLVLDGRGSIEVKADGMGRIHFDLEPGDFIYLSSGLYHRFFCSSERRFRFIRLVTDLSGWKSIYRKKKDLTAV